MTKIKGLIIAFAVFSIGGCYVTECNVDSECADDEFCKIDGCDGGLFPSAYCYQTCEARSDDGAEEGGDCADSGDCAAGLSCAGAGDEATGTCEVAEE